MRYMSMKLVSVNIEGGKHLDTVDAFLEREDADVVCLQECFGDTIESLSRSYPFQLYTPTYVTDQDENGLVEGERVWGEVIMSKVPLINTRMDYFPMDGYGPDNLPKYGQDNHVICLLRARVGEMDIGTIHFTWTPKSTITARQRDHMKLLLKLIEQEDLILCGDFNIARGNEMYQELTRVMQDNIPSGVETTVDPLLHYANKSTPGKLKLVVDYVWSTPRYKVSEVKVVSGVSDHCAIVCEIAKS